MYFSLVVTVYIRPLVIIVQLHGVKYQLYADDTQLYISLDSDNELNFSSSLKNVEHYIADIRLWMTQNLNTFLETPALQMGTSSIIPNRSVTYVRVICDKSINMYEHITSIYKIAY